ncbi:MAG: hypothetical protein K6E86_03455 [Bacteroidales bacterium]|nr:hypothetical protein [Bacteroidales bacterium]
MKKIYTLVAAVVVAATMQAQTLADYANAGDAAMSNQKYQEAIDNYIKAQELDKDNTDYMTAFQLATAYLQVGDQQKAGDAFKASLLKGNYDQAVINNMKNAYEAAGKPELVKQSYIEIKETNPDQKMAMDKKLYYIFSKEKDWANALPCCLTMLSEEGLSDDKKKKYLMNAAQLYLNLEQADSAEVYYDKVLAIDPTNANVHKALGYGLYNTIMKIKNNAEAEYNRHKNDRSKANHYYSAMQTATKRATLNYGPKAIDHLKIANKSLNDPEVAKIISQLENNVSAYKK